MNIPRLPAFAAAWLAAFDAPDLRCALQAQLPALPALPAAARTEPGAARAPAVRRPAGFGAAARGARV